MAKSLIVTIQRSIVLFKPVPLPTSDLKSEFLCQLSSSAQNLQTPPEPPRMPGTSPTPPSSRITHMPMNQVLSPSTLNRSCVCNVPSVLVTAIQLKSSEVFHSNVTKSQGQTLSAGQKHSKAPQPLTSWRTKDQRCQQARSTAKHYSHSPTGEPKTGIFSR